MLLRVYMVDESLQKEGPSSTILMSADKFFGRIVLSQVFNELVESGNWLRGVFASMHPAVEPEWGVVDTLLVSLKLILAPECFVAAMARTWKPSFGGFGVLLWI